MAGRLKRDRAPPQRLMNEPSKPQWMPVDPGERAKLLSRMRGTPVLDSDAECLVEVARPEAHVAGPSNGATTTPVGERIFSLQERKGFQDL